MMAEPRLQDCARCNEPPVITCDKKVGRHEYNLAHRCPCKVAKIAILDRCHLKAVHGKPLILKPAGHLGQKYTPFQLSLFMRTRAYRNE